MDNTPFIAKHHKTSQNSGNNSINGAHPARTNTSRQALIALVYALTVLALCFFGVIAISGQVTLLSVTILAALALCAICIGIGVFVRSDSDTENGALYHAILEGSRAARVITDPQSATLYYNVKFEHLCRGVGTPTYQTLERLFEGTPESLAHLRNLGDKGGRGLIDSVELFSTFEDQERWLLVTVQPVSGFKGHVHWRVDDVTDKYTMDQAIREERENLIDFTDNAPVGFFSVNEHGRFMFANATFARWVGQDLKQLLYQECLHTYLTKPPASGAPYDILDEGGARQSAEIIMKGANGRTFLAGVTQVVIRDPQSGHVITRGVINDLTHEREMRSALRESEARFQRFFDEAPLGIVLVDSDHIIKQCNAAFAAMVGMHVSALENVDLNDVLHSGENGKNNNGNSKNASETIDAQTHIKNALSARGISQDLTLKTKSSGATGGVIETHMHARKMRETDHTVLHFIDVTDQKQLETQFVQSQKMQAIGQLAGGVAHDFNNLLTAMIGFCDLLLLRHKPGDPSFSDIMQIKQNSNRAANLVRQLLAFSRQQTLRPKVQDVTDILIEVSHLIRRLIGAGVELNLNHGQDLGFVKVDEGQMEQVLINLAVNARDAMDASGTLDMKTENFANKRPIELSSEELPVGHWIKISVIDTGSGITKENLSRIFEPFFTTKDVGEGTGLGLATVYGIVRQTDGFLDVQSKVGKGTMFILYLPRANELDKAAEEEISAQAVNKPLKDLTGSERLLLVEDEDAVRTFSQRALANKGYDVLAADSGETALTLYEEQTEDLPLDLIITDVVMPSMDGPTLVQRVRQTNPDIKVIFISGFTEDKLKDYIGKNTWFLPKPFTLKQLAEKVKDVLES